jgi:IS605 OrfB family transposase
MIRSSKHILKYQTNSKTINLEKLFEDYKLCLESYVGLILNENLPLNIFLSSKLLPDIIISHGQWKQVVYKHASEIVRSCLKKHNDLRFKRYKKVYKYFINSGRLKSFTYKRFSELKLNKFPKTLKIDLKNININLDERIFDILCDSKEFDEFINIRTPYRDPNGKHRKSTTIKVPLKHHKHSLKFQTWNRKNTIKLSKINNNFYAALFYEKEETPIKLIGNSIGVDCGYKKLLVLSDGQIIGKSLEDQYIKISNKKQGSKNFNQTLLERDKLINQELNKIDLSQINQLIIEDLKNVKHKSKLGKSINNKLQRWTYPKVLDKLERLCQENGIQLTKINPAYTSQTCSRCGTLDKKSRKGELFRCNSCNLEIDADYNASINILYRGVYNPSTSQSLKQLDLYGF